MQQLMETINNLAHANYPREWSTSMNGEVCVCDKAQEPSYHQPIL